MKITPLKGKQIDITALRERHGAVVAIGNSKMNARGDLLGKGGVVIKSSEEISRDYFENNPNAVASSPVSLKDISDEIVMTPKQAMAAYDDQRVEAASAIAKTKRKTRETDD